MPELQDWYDARSMILEAVRDDLLGNDSEALTEAPLDRFIAGVLHPRGPQGGLSPAEQANEMPDDAAAGPEATDDPAVSFAHARFPSSMGLTFGLSEGASGIQFEVKATRYEGDDSIGPDRLSEAGPASRRRSSARDLWTTVPFAASVTMLELTPGVFNHELTEGLSLRVVVRQARADVALITAVLVNSFARPESGASDAFCWFRPVIKVEAIDGELMDRRPADRFAHLDEDDMSGELLYRNERSIAIGHGVSVYWPNESTVKTLETTFLPEHDLSLAKAERSDVPPLRMTDLAADARSDDEMVSLIAVYEDWVKTQTLSIPSKVPAELVHVATRHLVMATEAIVRMRRGLECIREDRDVERAFRVMNLAMNEQRRRQEMLRTKADLPPDIDAAWRPFQLAFILLNLESLADPSSDDRDIVDLLWFPTGGGKTEAYLGLIAFVLTLRRLRRTGDDETGGGVGVLMRYTLRLLTLQQFERAAGLICSLEEIRRADGVLADSAPFSIGLWVGHDATPNSIDAAARALRKKLNGEDPGDLGDPVQLLHCPWCGADLDASCYDADRRRGTMIVRCPNVECAFANGLPVHIIDSDVYAELPSLVIGTVDKFAMLAWNERSGRLFGVGVHAPPDLIIQDELHLISGPLGTLVGLYETAIDRLATSEEGVRPKVVASTATIRRARAQIRAVFARDARQFPPPGIDASDSFFAVDATSDEKGTRKYVGLIAPGASHATLLVRTYAALLQAAADLPASDPVRDTYWTLLGYFNSLRVLGAAFIQSIDDVRDRVKVVANRNGTVPRETDSPHELTSRIGSTQIPIELDRLARSYPMADAADVVLATNMISVGMDIDRLGLMTVMGQPQTTAEYIQATSRVGRKFPGLVFALYNASRSRDLSHYENFGAYHRTLYRQVEATGATPFAARALDRGLHGVLVALARHTIPGAAPTTSVSVPLDTEALRQVVQLIMDRVSATLPDDSDLERIEADVRGALESLLAQWADAVEEGNVNRYEDWFPNSRSRSLIIPAGAALNPAEPDQLVDEFPPVGAPWPTLTSLRNVDRESTLRVVVARRRARGATDVPR